MFCSTATSASAGVRIAMAQIFCLDGDRAGNFRRIENAVAEASENDADIVCFPEAAILGWVNPDAHKRAFAIPGPDTERLSSLAKKYKIYVCVGLAEKEGDKLYNSVVLIDESGKILLKHRKINILTKSMTPPYTPGSEVRTCDTKFGKIGLLICADSFQQDLLSEMNKLKPDLLLIPYGWAKEEEDWPEHAEQLVLTVKRAAREVGCRVIGTNLNGEISHGPSKGMVYGGGSVASDSKGKIIGRCGDRDRDIQIVTIEN